MNKTEFIKNNRKFIAIAETKKAIKNIKEHALETSSNELRDEIIIIENKFNKYSKEQRIGLNTNENLNLEITKINNSILELLNKIESDEISKNSDKIELAPTAKDIKKITSFLIYFLGIVALINYFVAVLGEIRYPAWLIYLHLPFIWYFLARVIADVMDKLNLSFGYRNFLVTFLVAGIIVIPISTLRTYYFISPFSALDKNLRVIVFPFEEEYTCSEAKINLSRILSKDIKEAVDETNLNITVKEGFEEDYPQGKLGAKDFIHKRGAHFGIWGTYKENCETNIDRIELNYFYAYFDEKHPLEYQKSEWSFQDIDSVREDLTKEIFIVTKLIGSNFLFKDGKWKEGIQQYSSTKIDCNQKLLYSKIKLGISTTLQFFKENKKPSEVTISLINELITELINTMNKCETCNFTLSDEMTEFRKIMVNNKEQK